LFLFSVFTQQSPPVTDYSRQPEKSMSRHFCKKYLPKLSNPTSISAGNHPGMAHTMT